VNDWQADNSQLAIEATDSVTSVAGVAICYTMG